VEDLAAVLEKIRRLLRARGRLVVYEFAWDKFDRTTADWLWARRSALKPKIRRRLVGRTAADSLKAWRRTFHDLHRYPQLRREMDRRFAARFFAWTPYLHYFPGDVSTEPQERRAIEVGAIQPLGFRYVGGRR
jgi:SAM-dependent methyltransferase